MIVTHDTHRRCHRFRFLVNHRYVHRPISNFPFCTFAFVTHTPFLLLIYTNGRYQQVNLIEPNDDWHSSAQSVTPSVHYTHSHQCNIYQRIVSILNTICCYYLIIFWSFPETSTYLSVDLNSIYLFFLHHPLSLSIQPNTNTHSTHARRHTFYRWPPTANCVSLYRLSYIFVVIFSIIFYFPSFLPTTLILLFICYKCPTNWRCWCPDHKYNDWLWHTHTHTQTSLLVHHST